MKLSIAGGWRRRKERYALIGTHCETCNNYFFPIRSVCPNCRRKGKVSEVSLKPEGTILSYTEVNVAPSGFELNVPYTLALVQLEEGPIILSEIVDAGEKEVAAGKKVNVVFRKIREDGAEGVIHYGYKFEMKK